MKIVNINGETHLIGDAYEINRILVKARYQTLQEGDAPDATPEILQHSRKQEFALLLLAEDVYNPPDFNREYIKPVPK